MKMTKKLFSLLLCAVMMLGSVAVGSVTAAAETIDSGSCGENVTWSLSGDGVLTISGKEKMNDVGPEGAIWHLRGYSDLIKSVVIKEGVTSVGSNAFYNCTNLTDISLPDSITAVRTDAFFGTDYYNNEANWKDGALYVGNHLIKCVTDATEFAVKEGTKTIAGEAFANCGLTSVILPEGITRIDDHAFFDCKNLTNPIIPDSVTGIGVRAFYGTGYYKNEANWENGVLYIGNNLIECNTDAMEYSVKEGTKIIADYAFEKREDLTSVNIPDGVTCIGDYAFALCHSLESINIPGSVTRIDDCAFWDCNSLTSVTISDSVTCIGDYAFANCHSLKSINIPGSVTRIDDSAFWNCNSLTSVTISDGVKSIGNYAFSGCSNLKSISLPAGVDCIETGAFNGCVRLTDVYYGGTEEQSEEIEIRNDNECLTDADWHFHTHSMSKTQAKDATCTEDGNNEYYTCSTCNKVFKDVEGKNETTVEAETVKAGHDYVNHEAKAPTCEEVGWEAYQTCSRCDYTTYKEIKAPGHSFTNYVYNNDESFEADGTETAKCDRCDKTDTRVKEGSRYQLRLTIKGYKPTLDVDYYSTVTFNCEDEIPEGYTIKWSNGQTGETCTVKKLETETKISCWLEKDGEKIDSSESDEVTVNVNDGFFAKIVAFIRNIFGLLPKYADFVKMNFFNSLPVISC